MLLYIALFACVLFSPLSATIVETNEISSIDNSVTKDSLVFLNVTGVLYEPANTLADNRWRMYFAERVNTLVSDQAAAGCLINKVKNDIVQNLPKKPVEEGSSQMITSLQNQQIPVLGITQKQMSAPYADNFGVITKNHLLSVGVDWPCCTIAFTA